jgi:hypothetical protein
MNQWMAMLAGAGFGAGAMYILDPDLGARRRALAKDQFERLPNTCQQAAAVTARDIKNRTIGFVSEARAWLFESEVDDEVLVDRVRSKLGFLVRHPSAITVQGRDGSVILSGPVLADESEQLMRGVGAIRGVRHVENRLEVHAEPGSVSALQGDRPKRTGQPLDVLQRHWSPATRFLIGAGSALLLYSIGRHAGTAVIVPGSLIAAMMAYHRADGDAELRSDRRGSRAAASISENEATAGWSN